MILTCPSCGSRFRVDPAAVGGDGRRVRCVRCRHLWFEQQPGTISERARLGAASDEQELAARRSGLSAVREKRGGANWARWVALVVIVGDIVGGGVLAREQIVATWPPAAKLYELVRLPVESAGAGLELRNLRPSQEVDNGMLVLVVEGEVVNVSDQVREVPRIRIALRDVAGHEIAHWLISAAQARLEPGQSAGFQARREEPPPEVKGLRVSFEAGN